MNEKLIIQQQQQIKNLSDEITLMRMKYEGIGSIYNRQHLQSQLDKANEKIRQLEQALEQSS